MHYYEFNIGDYRRRTTHLTPIEHYIYRTLLDWYFLDEKPLKANMDYLLRILALPKRNKEQVQNVLNDFFIEVDGFYHNKRVDEMLQGYHANRENGKKGGRPKKSDDNPNKNDVQTDDNPSESDTKPNENPNETQIKPNEKATINQEPITNINTHTNTHEQNFDSGQDFENVMKWMNTWQPTMHEVNSVLQMAGEKQISENDFNHMKFAFVSHYQPKLANGSMRTSQLLGKLVSWVKNQNLNQIDKSKSGGANHETRKRNSNHESPSEYQQRLHDELRQYGYDIGATNHTTDPSVIDGDYRDVC